MPCNDQAKIFRIERMQRSSKRLLSLWLGRTKIRVAANCHIALIHCSLIFKTSSTFCLPSYPVIPSRKELFTPYTKSVQQHQHHTIKMSHLSSPFVPPTFAPHLTTSPTSPLTRAPLPNPKDRHPPTTQSPSAGFVPPVSNKLYRRVENRFYINALNVILICFRHRLDRYHNSVGGVLSVLIGRCVSNLRLWRRREGLLGYATVVIGEFQKNKRSERIRMGGAMHR